MHKAALTLLAGLCACAPVTSSDTVPDAGAPSTTTSSRGGVTSSTTTSSGSTTSSLGISTSAIMGAVDAGGAWDSGGFLPPGRSAGDVCAAYLEAVAISPDADFIPGNGGMCDPGLLPANAIHDAVKRINFYRWLANMAPVLDDATSNRLVQACAVTAAWNAPGPSAHFPTAASTCFTQDAAAGAGTSNIAWGSGSAAGAIDIFMQDPGNETTMGHRRWLLNPPLSPVGIGYYAGGNQYGNASCVQVLNMGGTGPVPAWTAWPPPGFVPAAIAGMPWTFHSSSVPLGGLQASAVRVGDGAQLGLTVVPLAAGYGEPTVSLQQVGWSVEAGQSYRVTITPAQGAPITYELAPAGC